MKVKLRLREEGRRSYAVPGNAVEDVYYIYGGDIETARIDGAVTRQTLVTTDGIVTALYNPRAASGRDVTLVGFRGLQSWRQRTQWLAFQAYLAVMGAQPATLGFEVPGSAAADEYETVVREGTEGIERIRAHHTAQMDQYRHGSVGLNKQERQGRLAVLWGRQAATLDLYRAQHFLEPPDDFSVRHGSHGESVLTIAIQSGRLPASVKSLGVYVAGMAFHDGDQDPTSPIRAAARAVGSPSIEHLYDLWDDAMQSGDPRLAGRFVVNSTVYPIGDVV